MREQDAEENGKYPCANEAFHRLLGRQLDQLSPAEGDAADVGEDIVGDDKGSRQEEPDHALENIVHDEVGLHDDQEEGHVRPCELGELELEMTSL